MKKYIENMAYQTFIRIVVAGAVALPILFFGQRSIAQTKPRFTPLERTIIRGVIGQYKKECGYVSVINESKLSEIQKSFQTQKDVKATAFGQCIEQYLGQMVGSHNIYKGLCDEVTSQKQKMTDSDYARIFVTIKKFEGGIRPYHEKLNDCLVRKEAPKEVIRDYSDFEMNSKILSQKIREVDTAPPFRENRVDFR